LQGLLSFFLSVSIVSADVVVASNLPPATVDSGAWEEVGLIAPSYNNYNNVSKGQSFTSHITGTLTTVDALIGAGGSTPIPGSPPLNVSIYSSNDGIPLTVLGTIQVPVSSIAGRFAPNNRERIDFSDLGIPLVSGNEYMVAFETPFGISGTNGTHAPYHVGWPPARVLGQPASQARNGVDWEVMGNAREIGIEVRAIPEPDAVVLFFISTTALLAMSNTTIRSLKRV
jgi:hypothetical protein